MTRQTLSARLAALRSAFLRLGWLAPALFPVANIGGRGLFNTLFFGYILWALLALSHLRRKDLIEGGKHLAMLGCAYAPSIFIAEDAARAIKIWATVLLYMSTGAITYAVLRDDPKKITPLLRALAIGALAALTACYLDLFKTALTSENFVPRLDLRTVDLVIFAPFLVGYSISTPHTSCTLTKALAAYALTAGMVIFADERTTLVSFLAASVTLCLLVTRISALRVLASGLALLALAIVLNGDALLRGLELGDDLFQRLDQFSSGRLTLWHQAIQHPPANPWFGVGMGNTQGYREVVSIGSLEGHTVRHLHNLWLDAWYETGLVGVGTLALVLIMSLVRSIEAWRTLPQTQRLQAGLLLSSTCAVLVQTQFSISYASREFNIYAMLFLAVLAHLANTPDPTPSPTVRNPSA
ncbi:O-antigen ligase family protein [Thauera sp. JM12B12]|uniref:O-antigen ligase family protein n=1 Tax=Thauera sp. JM12B12 TaxID=3142262 RepID=UPI0031F3D0A9